MTTDARKQSGQRCRATRESRELTQRAFGDLVGVDQVTVSRWENGLRVPNFETRMLVARVLGSDPWAIDVTTEAPQEAAS